MRPLNLIGWACWLGAILVDGPVGWWLLGSCSVAWIADAYLEMRRRA